MENERVGRLVRGLGPIAIVALAAGNVVGSGIYVMPAQLAEAAGPLSLVALVGVAAGYLCLTSVFADLVAAFPISGGPQTFAKRALGDFVGQQVAFVYWISAIISNAAFVTGFIGYLAVFVPAVNEPKVAFLVAEGLLWSLTLVNILGVRAGGAVQVVTMILKMLPLLVLSAFLLPHASSANLVPFAPHGMGGLLPAIGLIAWLFIGAESVTVPADEVKDAGPTIRRGAYIGYALAVFLYFLVISSVMLALPSSAIIGSTSPLAVAGQRFLGPWGSTFVTLGALVSIAGILNGWLLVAGRLPYAAARDGFAPAWMARVHPRFGTPAVGLAVSSAVTGVLIVLYFVQTLQKAYTFVALFATSTALFAILAACVAEIVLIRREPARFSPSARRRGTFTASVGIVIVLILIAGAGAWIAALSLACLVIPTAYYFLVRRSDRGPFPNAEA